MMKSPGFAGRYAGFAIFVLTFIDIIDIFNFKQMQYVKTAIPRVFIAQKK